MFNKIIAVASAVEQPKVDSITKDSVTLSWKKPLDDGGSVLSGYVIEKKNPNGEWEEILEVPPKDTSIMVKDVKEGEECQFRVRAKNDAGLSKPSKPTDVIKIEDQPGK
jgi:titin